METWDGETPETITLQSKYWTVKSLVVDSYGKVGRHFLRIPFVFTVTESSIHMKIVLFSLKRDTQVSQ